MPNTPNKLRLKDNITECIDHGYTDDTVARKIYCFDKSPILELDEYKSTVFDIINSVSNDLRIPIRNIYITGSAQTGYSYTKDHDFNAKKSDLDLAVVSPKIFAKYLDEVFNVTKRYTDNTKFESTQDIKDFRNYIAKGMLKIEYMPQCKMRILWEQYFNDLSNSYIDIFKNINCCIYLTEKIFEWKQVNLLENYRNDNHA